MPEAEDRFVRVRGAREHNLKSVDVDIPRNALVVFAGVSGSGKSSLAFGTLYAEAQRRYFESISPYARRLIDQVGVPDVDSIEGLPPAIALQQQRGGGGTRSSVGSITTISNLLRMLYSRAGTYPDGQRLLHAEDFSPNTPQGACPVCHGLGRVYDATEASMVLDPSLTIRERAIAAWPAAWQGQNLRDILVTLGYDVDKPWRELSRRDRHWILFTEEQPTVPVYAGLTPRQARAALKSKDEPSYLGTFTSARRHLMHTFATTHSDQMKRRAARFLIGAVCAGCDGKRLKQEALGVTFAGLDIGDLSQLTLDQLADRLELPANSAKALADEKRMVAERITGNVRDRIRSLQDLGLGYLSLDRSSPTLSPGEMQRLRLATQIRSNLFGVVYVLDEPSAGLHPADGEALLESLQKLKRASNSLFVVEHDVDIMRRADWLVEVGPAAGERGGEILYSGPPQGLAGVRRSPTAPYLFHASANGPKARREPKDWIELRGVTRNNLRNVTARFPLQVMTAVTGVSGSGKSSLVSHALVQLVADHLDVSVDAHVADPDLDADLEYTHQSPLEGQIHSGLGAIRRLVTVDQKPIGRTPRSNLATYTGLFDPIRRLFAATPAARKRRFDAGQFSFNVAKGRCAKCEGAGFVCVELLFMPSVFAPCPECRGARYSEATLQVRWHEHSIADVLDLRVEDACGVFSDEPAVLRPLELLRDIGLDYLRLGQPATELSGGEAQRIKLATELQRAGRGGTLYVLDEPGTGLHPADVDRLLTKLQHLVDGGNTVIFIEHDMRMVAASDWVMDMGPGAGDMGGNIIVCGTPETVAISDDGRCRTARYLRAELQGKSGATGPTDRAPAGFRSAGA